MNSHWRAWAGVEPGLQMFYGSKETPRAGTDRLGFRRAPARAWAARQGFTKDLEPGQPSLGPGRTLAKSWPSLSFLSRRSGFMIGRGDRSLEVEEPLQRGKEARSAPSFP